MTERPPMAPNFIPNRARVCESLRQLSRGPSIEVDRVSSYWEWGLGCERAAFPVWQS
jgi:hypothetical protein